MKPILVTNQSEWQRLAPVLERQGYRWCVEEWNLPTKWNPLDSPVHKLTNNIVITVADYANQKIAWMDETEYLEFTPKTKQITQSVDEYLLNDSLNELRKAACRKAGIDENTPAFATTAYNHPERFGVAEHYVEPDYKAKYQQLAQAVRDAMETKLENINLNSDKSEYQKAYAHALGRFQEILTEKTKNLI